MVWHHRKFMVATRIKLLLGTQIEFLAAIVIKDGTRPTIAHKDRVSKEKIRWAQLETWKNLVLTTEFVTAKVGSAVVFQDGVVVTEMVMQGILMIVDIDLIWRQQKLYLGD